MFSTHESRPAGGHVSMGRAVPGHRVINANVIDLTTDKDSDLTTSQKEAECSQITSSEPKIECLARIRTDIHKLCGTEQEALDAMVKRFFDDSYFRSKVVRNGAAILTGSPASVDPTVRRFFDDSSFQSRLAHHGAATPASSAIASSALARFPLSVSSTLNSRGTGFRSFLRQSYFRYLDLPPEIRIIIAKHVLHVPEGLHWKWKTYRKASKVATLCEPSWHRKELEVLNALTRSYRTT